MKKILYISCSPRGVAAESHRLSLRIVESLRQRVPDSVLISRDIGSGSIPHVDRDYAISQASLEDISPLGSMARSEELVEELESADFVVIGTPMHNLTVPSTLKAWIDHVVRARRTFVSSPTGKLGRIGDRPVFIAIASGGCFSGERARQPDFLTPYLKYILGTIGLHDVALFSVQGTAAPPEIVEEARAQALRAIQAHFSTLMLEPDLADRQEPSCRWRGSGTRQGVSPCAT